MNSSRIAVVNSHPIQYFAPLYAFLHANAPPDVTALYLSDFSLRGARDPGFGIALRWDVDLMAGYPSVFVDTRAAQRTPGGFFSLVAPAIWRQVREGGYDALLSHGHGYAANLIAIAAARSVGMPVFMRCDARLGVRRRGLVRWLKRLVRRPVLGLFYGLFVDRCLPVGSANAAYYRAMGVPERKMIRVPYAIDNARFAAVGDRRPARLRLGVSDDTPIILFAAKLVAQKHPDDLIRAVALLAAEGVPLHLAFVGAGQRQDALKSLAAELGLSQITFAGFINQAELPGIYAAADVFVLPADDEAWGLAINEAMAAGLPIVAASGVGCVPDLVIDGRNGARFPVGDITALADALRMILLDPERRAKMGQASLEIISEWSFAACREGLRAAMDSVRKTRPKD